MKHKLIELLKEAQKNHQKFAFCDDYYNSHQPELCLVAKENSIKNKENHWGFPYDHNLIQTIPEYINASPMQFGPHRYIAAQGPRSNTFAEFWNMVWAEGVSLIVSVTNEREDKNRGCWNEMKFDRFWPNQEEEKFGDFFVELLKETLIQEWDDGREERLVRRDLRITHQNHSRYVTHLHMENWPDNGVIHPESLYSLSLHADRYKQQGAIAVHCAAGVGRTGTFIAFHSLYHDLLNVLKGIAPIESHSVPSRIEAMRKLRWGAMVADVTQYHLLINALELALSHVADP